MVIGQRRYGQIVHESRKALGLSLERVAKAVGSHKGYLSGIENGKVRPPSARVSRKLCQVLRLDVKCMLMRAWAEKAPQDVREDAMDLVFRHYL